MKTIEIDGAVTKISNAFSCGPGEKPHTFMLAGSGGCYVYSVAGAWFMQRPGNFPVPAVVSLETLAGNW